MARCGFEGCNFDRRYDNEDLANSAIGTHMYNQDAWNIVEVADPGATTDTKQLALEVECERIMAMCTVSYIG